MTSLVFIGQICVIKSQQHARKVVSLVEHAPATLQLLLKLGRNWL